MLLSAVASLVIFFLGWDDKRSSLRRQDAPFGLDVALTGLPSGTMDGGDLGRSLQRLAVCLVDGICSRVLITYREPC